MAIDLVKTTLAHAEIAFALRNTWTPRWQDIAEYEAPSLANFTSQISPGQERGQLIFNSHGVKCAEDLAIRIDGFLTGGGTTWFDLRMVDNEAADEPAVREWLDRLCRIFFSIFNSPASGFETAKEAMYQQLVCFGNAPVYMGESDTGWPKFRSEFLGNCAIWADEDGWPSAVFRKYKQTAFRLVQQFGAPGMPDEVTRCLDKEPMREFTCVHAVRPIMEGDPPDLMHRPYIETYVLMDKQHLLEPARFYYEFPWLWPRWKVSPGEIYGRGPGDRALQDVKMLQKMEKDLTKHISMQVDHMVVTPDDGNTPRINQVPGAHIYAPFSPNGTPLIARLGPGGSPKDGMEMRESKKQEIEKLFYLDAFKMIEKISPKGAVIYQSVPEFAARLSEQMRTAGPALARLRAEFLYPLMARMARICLRNGKLPDPPPQLRDSNGSWKRIIPELVGPLAIAQQNNVRGAIMQYLGDIVPLTQVDPSILDVSLHGERTALELARAHHVPQSILPMPEEIAARRRAKADAAAQQAQVEQAGMMAKASSDNATAMARLRGVA